MAYYNEFFIEIDDELIHIGSSNGSDSMGYFLEVQNVIDWNKQLKELEENNGFSSHSDVKHCFPWKTYKTSDHLIVLRPNKKRWYEFWIPPYSVWVSIDKYEINDAHRSYFIPINKYFTRLEDTYADYKVALNIPHIPSI